MMTEVDVVTNELHYEELKRESYIKRKKESKKTEDK